MDLKVFDIGLIKYRPALAFQKETFKAVKYSYLDSAIIFCQHYPVITMGRNADRNSILVSGTDIAKMGIEICSTERGGDLTYHGPGQLTVYPVLNLNYFVKDIHWFLRYLEQIIIELLSDFGIKAERKSGLTGVWVEDKKIASIGIAIKNWITFHGLSINIKHDDLENFHLIKPCGLDIEMTSMESISGGAVEIDKIKKVIISKFRDTLSFGKLGVPRLESWVSLMEEVAR